MSSAFLHWKLQRLRTMDAREVAFRLARACTVSLEKIGIGLAKWPPEPRLVFGRAWCDTPIPSVDPGPYVTDAERVLAGRFSVFELHELALGFPPVWNRDPKLGVDVPLLFGKTLDYRMGNDYRYTRYIVEFNRHLELVRLAQAYALTLEPRFATGCRTMLLSWFEQCPYPFGPHWNNSLEHGIRLVNWAVAWHLLGAEHGMLFRGPEGRAFQRRWLDSVFQHCHFIAGHLSLHSSGNNHLYGEYMGLFVASLTWPCWRESDRWRESAHRGLESEANRQVGPDGVNLEQAISYHREVATMMLLALLFARANGHVFSVQFQSKLEAMLDHVASVMDAGGHVPMIGDSDDAPIVHFCAGDRGNLYRPLLATAAVLFSRADFRRKAGRFDDGARWLLGDQAAAKFDSLPHSPDGSNPRRSFPDSGYFVLGDSFNTAREVRLVADAGPLGYLTTAGHGHADALAFTLSLGGREMLIDSGTYGYQVPRVWRDFFRGTSAHNTVRVDGEDQSVSGGNFLWVRHARASCRRFDAGRDVEVWEGIHDGYGRLSDPVIHRRRIEFYRMEGRIRVLDVLEASKVHSAEIFWHFSENCSVRVNDSEVSADNGGIGLRAYMHRAGWSIQLFEGHESLPQGWVSRRYGEKVAAPTVVFAGGFVGSVEILTEFVIDFPAD